MSGHTPGPWEAKKLNWRFEPDPHKFYISGDEHECDSEDDEDNGDLGPLLVATSVAIVEGNATSAGVTTANARLIAAAPDLLAACQAFVRWYEATEPYDGPPVAAIHGIIKSAVARATTEPTT